MAVVVPTVLATTPDEYTQMLARAEALSQRVHVDVCDGHFADATTIGLAQVHTNAETELDLHLMLTEPLMQLETALSLKPHLIIFHAESTGDLATAITQVQGLRIRAGLALLASTTPKSQEQLIAQVDHVLIFTGTLGHNRGQFQPEQLEKIAQVRAIKPRVEVSVDGGVTDRNVATIVRQGVDVLYEGSYLQTAADPAEAFRLMQRLGAGA